MQSSQVADDHSIPTRTRSYDSTHLTSQDTGKILLFTFYLHSICTVLQLLLLPPPLLLQPPSMPPPPPPPPLLLLLLIPPSLLLLLLLLLSHSASTWPWPCFLTGTQAGFYPSFLSLWLSSGALVVHITSGSKGHDPSFAYELLFLENQSFVRLRFILVGSPRRPSRTRKLLSTAQLRCRECATVSVRLVLVFLLD